MKIASPLLLLALITAGCTGTLRVDDSAMPAGTFPPGADIDTAALYEAGLALGGSLPPPVSPQGWARAFADIEYVSGAYNTHTRWLGIEGSAQAQILIARQEIRDAVGIPAAARSQDVLNALLAVSAAPDVAAAKTVMANPVFSLGPDQTMERFQHVPAFFTTPAAIAHLNIAKDDRNGSCNRLFC